MLFNLGKRRERVVHLHASEGKGNDSDVGLSWFTRDSENFDLPKAKVNRGKTIQMRIENGRLEFFKSKFNQAAKNDGTS